MSQTQNITESPVNQIPPRRGRPRINPEAIPGADPGGLVGTPSNPRKPRARRGAGTGLNLQQIGTESRRQAAAVLEVLAGVRTPLQAAQELGMALPVYYKLEQRALASVVEACQPRPRGPRPSPDRDLAIAKRECETLSRELHRQQALTRAAQRAIGLSAVPTTRPSDKSPDKSPGKRSRKPMARALRAIAELRQPQPPTNAAEPPASGA